MSAMLKNAKVWERSHKTNATETFIFAENASDLSTIGTWSINSPNTCQFGPDRNMLTIKTE